MHTSNTHTHTHTRKKWHTACPSPQRKKEREGTHAHPDAQKMRAKVEFKLTKSGDIDGRVKVKVTGTDRGTSATLAVNVRGTIQECAPYSNLPAEKYETWKDMVVNFSLQDML